MDINFSKRLSHYKQNGQPAGAITNESDILGRAAALELFIAQFTSTGIIFKTQPIVNFIAGGIPDFL